MVKVKINLTRLTIIMVVIIKLNITGPTNSTYS